MPVSGAPLRLLLTGATGFIGQHLHRRLLDRGHSVRILLRPASVARASFDARCEVTVGDLTDVPLLARALTGIDAIVYAAGTVRGRRFEDFRGANVAGLEALVAALGSRDAPAPFVLLMSSLAAERPELSDYARSKRAGEEVLRNAPHLSWSILRPPAVYGPGDVEMRPLLKLVKAGLAVCPGPPGQRLSLLHVADLVRAVEALLDHPEACRHRCFGLDDGKPNGYDWREIGLSVAGRAVRQLNVPPRLLGGLARVNLLAARLLGYAPMLTPGKVRELQQPGWLCDNRALALATGWEPEIDLASGTRML
jgi:2-alkyl-3-oxoalkanoate reductase